MLSAPRDPPSWGREDSLGVQSESHQWVDGMRVEANEKVVAVEKARWREKKVEEAKKKGFGEAICIVRKNSKNFFTPTRSHKYQPFYTRTRYFTRTRSAVCAKRDDFLLRLFFYSFSKSFINESFGESSHDNADFSLSLSWLAFIPIFPSIFLEYFSVALSFAHAFAAHRILPYFFARTSIICNEELLFSPEVMSCISTSTILLPMFEEVIEKAVYVVKSSFIDELLLCVRRHLLTHFLPFLLGSQLSRDHISSLKY